MRIHELIPYDGLDLIIHNEDTGHTMVLTSVGAVYRNEFTDDVRNIAIAFGALFTSDKWRVATSEEVTKFRNTKETTLLNLEWAPPPPKEKPHFTIVKGIKTSGDTDIGNIE